ncbi:GNAT family N-acetyltransferase [Yunchengibacter salinarum]|uniref:GNAT family N-acetyltransferase n=1 Tax=Yunchengibacter salinarum TaxID=3133399 RepID=UPI0035B57A03
MVAGIETGMATFDTEPKSRAAFEQGAMAGCTLVARRDGNVVGWVALWPVSPRACYRGVGEVSVYVDPSAARTGVGAALLGGVQQAAEANGIWTIEAKIFPDNAASLELHDRCGFRRVGVREKMGESGGRFRDVVILEWRSHRVGWPVDASPQAGERP